MKYTIQFLIVLLAILTISSDMHAQYRWQIVHSDQIDTFYCAIQDISCTGESCSAVGYVWSFAPGDPKGVSLPDSNIILRSIDGGQTWNPTDSILPQWTNGYTGDHILLHAIDQFDSLDAIAVGTDNVIISTSDGWKTWLRDTGFALITEFGRLQDFDFAYVDFSSVAEGVVGDNAVGYALSTLDSGRDWAEEQDIGYPTDLGDSLFRTYVYPNMVLTTRDNWNTIDTSLITFNGSFSVFEVSSWLFGGGDTVYALWNSGTSVMLSLSSDLGAHWAALPLPPNINITQPIISSINAQTIVIAGTDSVGRIILSTDHGATWQADTVALDSGVPYFWIWSVAVTGSGRVLASITTDSNFQGSRLLAYLEPIPSSVSPTVSTQQNLTLYPNPATNVLNLVSPAGTISISDPLGRSYAVPRNGDALDISTLPPGVYFVSDGVNRAKFVKE